MMSSLLKAVLIPLAALAIAAAAPAAAQQPAADGAQTSVPTYFHETAPVIIDGTTLFNLRGATALPAAERAASVSRRIQEIAADPTISPDTVVIVPWAFGLRINAGQRLIVTIVQADADQEGVEREVLAEILRTRIRQGIKAYRSERSPEVVKARVIFALAALAITALLVVGFLIVTRLLMKVIDRRYRRYIEAVKIQSFRLVRAEQIYTILRGSAHLLRTLVTLGMVYACAVYVLGLFPWTRPAANRLVDYLLEPLGVTVSAVLDSVPNLIIIVIIYLVARGVLKLTRGLFQAIEFGSVRFARFEPEWARPTYKLVRVGVIVFALVIAYPYIPGSSSAAFKGVSIFAGIILSLGSSSIISNIVAGYSMIYRRAYAAGDWIQVGDVVGEVLDLRLLVTHLRSAKNEAIVLPNSKVLNAEVVNYSALAKKRGLLLHPTVGIGYEVPWRQVEVMLTEAAMRTEGIRAEPAPFVLVKALGDFAVTYELNVGCENPRQMPQLYTLLYRNILDVFNEKGVQIMTPNYVADTDTPKLVPRDQSLQQPVASE